MGKRTHHCSTCKAAVSHRCIDDHHIAKCNEAGCGEKDIWFATEHGCHKHSYKLDFNLQHTPRNWNAVRFKKVVVTFDPNAGDDDEEEEEAPKEPWEEVIVVKDDDYLDTGLQLNKAIKHLATYGNSTLIDAGNKQLYNDLAGRVEEIDGPLIQAKLRTIRGMPAIVEADGDKAPTQTSMRKGKSRANGGRH